MATDERTTTHGISRSRVLGGLVSIALVVAVFAFFLPQFTSLSAVGDSVAAMTWLELTTLTVAALWNMATYLFVLVAAMPGLNLRQAFVVTESSTAVSNTVIGGGAIGVVLTYTMSSSWGFSRSRTSVAILVTGVWNNFVKLGMPVFALALLAFGTGASSGRLVAGLLGIAGLVAAVVLFWLLLRSAETAARVGSGAGRGVSAVLRLFGRPPVSGWDKATTKFRGRTVLLLRARWVSITITTLFSHASLFLVLLLALRHLGVSETDVSWIEVLAVFAFARLLTAIPFTPGGLGVVEVALITGLSAAGGARAQVAAAVLLFRALTYVLPIPIGVGTYIFWRRNTSWRRAPGAAPRTDLVPETDPEPDTDHDSTDDPERIPGSMPQRPRSS